MAHQIKETPVLSGRSSKKFNQVLAEQLKKQPDLEEKKRLLETVKKVLSKQSKD